MGAFLLRPTAGDRGRTGPLARARRRVAELVGAARATWAFLGDRDELM
jgi:hypothetical protein